MKKYFMSFLLIAVLLSAVGCGNSPPELNQIYSQINYKMLPGESTVRPELTVLFNADDEDGEDDIERVYIIRDDDEIFWSADRGGWNRRSSRGLNWYGSQRFVTADGSYPEPGEYRLLITDMAGERIEESIFIQPAGGEPDVADFAEIVFSDTGGTVEIKSPESRNVISFYDSEEKLLAAYSATRGYVDIGKLKDGKLIYENYKSIQIAYYSNSLGAGLISGPYQRP